MVEHKLIDAVRGHFTAGIEDNAERIDVRVEVVNDMVCDADEHNYSTDEKHTFFCRTMTMVYHLLKECSEHVASLPEEEREAGLAAMREVIAAAKEAMVDIEEWIGVRAH